MIINWINSEKYKNIRRPGIYNGQYFASSEEQRNYFIDKSKIKLIIINLYY